jgi:SAM-dependent methyltransferase
VDPDVGAVRDAWDRVSGAWDERADELAADSAPVRAALVEVLEPQSHHRVLELAGGTGALGRELAAEVAEVVCTDIAPGMVAAAARRAASAVLGNVTCQVADAHALAFDDASFDRVVCAFGLMLLPRPDAALREVRRVLRDGGRVAAATWGPAQENLGLIAIGAALLHHGHPVTHDPLVPGGVFSLSDPDTLRSLVADAGFQAVAVRPVAVERRYPRFEDYWDRNLAIGAPLRPAVEQLAPAELDAVRETCRSACEHLRTADGYRFTGRALVVSGRA